MFGKAFERARTAARRNGMVKSPCVHDLRHTHAAWLLTDGVPLLAVSRKLGHESIGARPTYTGMSFPRVTTRIGPC
jgi:integrase